MESHVMLQAMTLVMSTMQTCFLAYLAARYKTPWDIPIDAPKRPHPSSQEDSNG